MQNKPLLSVVTSIYNGGTSVKKFIDCILNQTYENIELVIVDDASTDKKTIKIVNEIEKLVQKNNKIKLIRNKTNLGLMKAFQKGLDAASGDYFAFPESDDYLDLDFYEVAMREIILHNGIDAVKGLMLNIYNNRENGDFVKLFKNKNVKKIINIYDNLIFPILIKDSQGRIVSFIMPDITYCWFYVFSKELLCDGYKKPNFKNAVLYGFDSSPYSIKYKECRITLDKCSFYYYNAHPKFEEKGCPVMVHTDKEENYNEYKKLKYEKKLLKSIFKKYDTAIDSLIREE